MMAIEGAVARNNSAEEAPPIPNPLKDTRHNKEFSVGKKLGEGGFARCFSVTNVETGELLCCKSLWKVKLRRDTDRIRARTEVAIHRRLNHPNIVKFHNACEDDNFVYIFMEVCNQGSLKDLLSRRKVLLEPEVRYYTRQLLDGVEYLMSQRVIHRDLKLANVFMASDMTLRIGDFGLAGQLGVDQDRRTTKCGTPNYTAPEVIDADGHSFGVDMWAIGVIMYTLLVGVPPFQVKGGLKLIYEKIRKVDLSFPKEKNVSPNAIAIVNMILQADPTQRPSFQQVRDHVYFGEFTPTSLPETALYTKPIFPATSVNSAKRTNDSDALKASEGKMARVRFSDVDADGFRRPLQTPELPSRQKITRSLSPNLLAPSVKKEPLKGVLPDKKGDKANGLTPANGPQVVAKPVAKSTSGKMLESFLNTINRIEQLVESDLPRDKIDAEIGTPSLKMPNFISKWIDQGSGHGFAYEFADGTTGVLFKEHCTLTSSPDKEHFEFIGSPNNATPNSTYFHKSSVPLDLEKYFHIHHNFTEYMDSELEGIVNRTEKDSPLEPHLLNPDPYPSPVAEGPEGPNPFQAKLPFLTKFFCSQIANFFRLSTGAFQMNLQGGKGKYVLAEGGRTVLIIQSSQHIRCYKLVDLYYKRHQLKTHQSPMNPNLEKILQHIEYFKTVLAYFIKCQASKPTAPAGSQGA